MKRALALMAMGLMMAADPISAQAPTPIGALEPWDQLSDQLKAIGPKMMAKLPPRLRDDPLIQQQATRLLLAALTRFSLQTIIGDRDHPIFLPALNVALNVFQPNADTTYKYAIIRPGGSYRLRGNRGTMRVVAVSETPPSGPETGTNRPRLADHDLDDLHIAKDGSFDVILSPTRPVGWTGDWWQIHPETSSIAIRQVAFDWGHETEPTISIDRIDVPASRGADHAEAMQQWLDELPNLVINTAGMFVSHVEELRDGGYINRFKIFDVSQMGGLSGQFYYEGAFDLKDDEALIIESEVPQPCLYWSVLLTNDIYETIDWYNNHSALNGSQIHVDKDGRFRMVVSARDPGVRNWLDTSGHKTGAIQGRWLKCAATPVPTIRKLPLSEVKAALPADTAMVTPEERDAIVRDRRSKLQQRSLW